MFMAAAKGEYEFVCLDRRPTKGVPDAFIGDLSDPDTVRKAMKGCDAVLHLGAFPYNNWDFMGVILPSNIMGAWNVLDAAVKEGVKRVVLASTVQTEFGYPDGVKVSVKMAAWPTNLYGASKVFAENAGLVFHIEHGLSVVCIRFGGVMVPERSGWMGGGSDIGLTANDACEIIRRALDNEDAGYAVVPAYSRNAAKIKDLEPLKEALGYEPREDSYEVAGKKREGRSIAEGGDADRVEAMLEAADRGDTNAMESFLKSDPRLLEKPGQDPHWESESMTPLQVAARGGKVDAVRFLLDRGANLEAKDGHTNRTALMFAALRRRKEVVDLLVSCGAKVDIHTAAAIGDLDRVKAFLDAEPALVGARGAEGATPLHYASTPEMARLLLDRGADPGARDEHRHRTTLFWAMWRPGVGKVIAEKMGVDDIFTACVFGETARVAELMKADPKVAATRSGPDHPIGQGFIPIVMAASRGKAEVVKALLAGGADPNALDRRGVTALHHAAGEGDLELVRLLLKHGANPNYRDENWESTALDWAQHEGHGKVAEVLKKAMECK